jgi:membrane protease YdiL (CAAX protease family)
MDRRQRWLWALLTVVAATCVFLSLWTSWRQPQELSRLDLRQNDLLLHAAAGDSRDDQLVRAVAAGSEPAEIFRQTQVSYERAWGDHLAALSHWRGDRQSLLKKQVAAAELGARLGLLKVHGGERSEAIALWEAAADLAPGSSIAFTNEILRGLWHYPVLLLPNGEAQIRRSLDGWYQYFALARLFQAQQRLEQFPALKLQAQTYADRVLQRLLWINGVPLLGLTVGSVLWLGLGIQWLVRRPQALLSLSQGLTWEVPWPSTVVWQVLVGWFLTFVVLGQVVLPLLSWEVQRLVPLPADTLQSLQVLLSYVLSVLPAIPITLWAIAPYPERSPQWFQLRWQGFWWLWGTFGYIAAIPLVLLSSLVTQKLLQGQGGGNPLLPILLEGHDLVPKLLLWLTVGVAAPILEEWLFRGFVLPSLQKALPRVAALFLSALLFAIAHLNLADLIPLTLLGMVLGFIYLRSGNLLAPIALHSLWNSGSFLTLLLLGQP